MNSSWTHTTFDQFWEIRVFQTCACDRCFNPRQALAWCCRALAQMRSCVTDARFLLPFQPRCGGLCVSQFCARFQRLATASHDYFMAQVKTASIHSPYFINLVAEPMEPIHAELLRLVTELEAVRGQLQTECNALRDLFARTTTAMSGSQHDRRFWKVSPTTIRREPS